MITTTGFLIALLFPYQCARLFTTDATLIDISIKAIRINMLAFPLVGSQMIITSFFQSIGKVKISIFLSLSRQLLFLLPLILVLPHFFGLDGVWWALPSSDTIAAVIAVFMMAIYMRKFKKEINFQTYGEQR